MAISSILGFLGITSSPVMESVGKRGQDGGGDDKSFDSHGMTAFSQFLALRLGTSTLHFFSPSRQRSLTDLDSALSGAPRKTLLFPLQKTLLHQSFLLFNNFIHAYNVF